MSDAMIIACVANAGCAQVARLLSCSSSEVVKVAHLRRLRFEVDQEGTQHSKYRRRPSQSQKTTCESSWRCRGWKTTFVSCCKGQSLCVRFLTCSTTASRSTLCLSLLTKSCTACYQLRRSCGGRHRDNRLHYFAAR